MRTRRLRGPDSGLGCRRGAGGRRDERGARAQRCDERRGPAAGDAQREPHGAGVPGRDAETARAQALAAAVQRAHELDLERARASRDLARERQRVRVAVAEPKRPHAVRRRGGDVRSAQIEHDVRAGKIAVRPIGLQARGGERSAAQPRRGTRRLAPRRAVHAHHANARAATARSASTHARCHAGTTVPATTTATFTTARVRSGARARAAAAARSPPQRRRCRAGARGCRSARSSRRRSTRTCSWRGR